MATGRLRLDDYRQLMVIRIVFAGAPTMYLLVIYMITKNGVLEVKPQPLVTYAFLALALLAVPAIPIVTRIWLSFQKRMIGSGDVRERASSLCIIRLSIAEACFVLGAAAFLLTFDYKLLYYFYPIGIVAMIMVWPTRERFDALVAQLEEK